MPGEMNPRERWGLLLIDEFPDRPPVFPLITSHSAKIGGIDMIKYSTRGKLLAETQIKAQKRYGHDGLSVFTDVGIIAEAMGSKYSIREFDVPILEKPLIENISQIDDLIIPDPQNSGRLPVYLEAIDILFEQKGDVLPIFAYIPCPFTTSAGLRGTENFLMDTVLDPESAKKLLDISLKSAIEFCDACILAGALPIMVDPLASGSVISRKTYAEFAKPYQKGMIDYLHRYDLDITLHICGDTSNILDLIPQTGADLFSFDLVQLEQVRNAMGEKVRLVGNLPPNELLDSSHVDVRQKTSTIISEGIVNPRGFVLSTGCEVPIQCNSEKLDMLIRLGKESAYNFGW